MSNFLLSALAYENFFDPSTPSGVIVILGLCLLALSVIGYIAVYFTKRDFAKTYLKIDFLTMLAYALAVAIYYIVEDFKGGETYTAKYQVWIVIAVIVIVAALIVLAILFDKKKYKAVANKSNSLAVAYAAVCIALSFGLSYIRLFKAPFGGSITLASIVPLAIYSYIFGWKKGLLCGLIYGFLQSVQDPWIVHPIQYILDYPLAFGFIGMFGGMFANFFKKSIKNQYVRAIVTLSIGLVVGCVFRYFSHALSGAIFFEDYMPKDQFDNVWVYTFTYNALYLFPDMAIAIVAGALLMASKVFRNQIDSVKTRLGATRKVKVENEVVQPNVNTVAVAETDAQETKQD